MLEDKYGLAEFTYEIGIWAKGAGDIVTLGEKVRFNFLFAGGSWWGWVTGERSLFQGNKDQSSREILYGSGRRTEWADSCVISGFSPRSQVLRPSDTAHHFPEGACNASMSNGFR
jgi:hypothetical protein